MTPESVAQPAPSETVPKPGLLAGLLPGPKTPVAGRSFGPACGGDQGSSRSCRREARSIQRWKPRSPAPSPWRMPPDSGSRRSLWSSPGDRPEEDLVGSTVAQSRGAKRACLPSRRLRGDPCWRRRLGLTSSRRNSSGPRLDMRPDVRPEFPARRLPANDLHAVPIQRGDHPSPSSGCSAATRAISARMTSGSISKGFSFTQHSPNIRRSSLRRRRWVRRGTPN